MKRLLLVLLVIFGCDDPAVASKALDVLEHGSLAAAVTCEGTFNCSAIGSNLNVRAECRVLQDGTSFATFSAYSWHGTSFNPRGQAVTARGAVSNDGFVDLACGDGEASLSGPHCGADFKVFDLETECTGFNLEAFGVEP